MKINLSSLLLYLIPLSLCLGSIPLTGELSVSTLKTSDQIFQERVAANNHVGITEQLTGLALWGFIYFIAFLLAIKIFNLYKESNRKIYTLFAFLTLPGIFSLFITQNFLGTLTLSVHLIGTALIGLCSAHLFIHHRDKFIGSIQFIIIIFLIFHLMFSFIMPEYSFSYKGRLQGMTNNPNSLARIALIAIIITFAARKIRHTRILNFSTIFLSSVVLYMTESVTAIVCAIIAWILFFIFARFSFMSRNLNAVSFLIILISPLLMFLITLVFESFLAISSRDSTLTGRTLIWGSALELISLKPIFGWGFANLEGAFEQASLAVTSYHNGYLDILVKGGLTALLFLVTMLITCFNRLKRVSLFDQPFCIIIMMTFMIYNITESTIYTPKNGLWIIFCFILFYVNLYQIKHQKNS